MSVYADVTFVTDIYLSSVQIIQFSWNIVLYFVDVDYAVCDGDVHIISLAVHVAGTRCDVILLKHDIQVVHCGVRSTVNGIVAFGVKLLLYIGIIMCNRMDEPFIVSFDIHVQRSDLPVDRERGVVWYADSHGMWP